MYKIIEEKANFLFPELCRLRKDFHRHPEIAWHELRTSQKIALYLKDLGYTVHEGTAVAGKQTGVIGDLYCDEGPVIALRFDIDALPISEAVSFSHIPYREGYHSKHAGYMHACGHDGHTTIGLGCARLIKDLQSQLHGTVRLIFQPAEEGAKGALPIVENNWLEHVSFFLSGHIFKLPDGIPNRCNVIPGVRSSLATTKIDLEFFGQSAHAAHPEQGHDVIAAMGKFITCCKQLSTKDDFIHFGTIGAGSGRNIIADHGRTEMETRSRTTEGDLYLNREINKLLKDIEKDFKVYSKMTVTGSAPSVVSSTGLSNELKMLYDQKLTSIFTSPSMIDFPASEDVSHMMDRVKEQGGEAVFLLFPAALASDLHHPDFDFPMELLPVGVTAYTSAVYHLLQI